MLGIVASIQSTGNVVIVLLCRAKISKKLEHPYPHTPKGILEGIPDLIILKPCSNFLEFTIGVLYIWSPAPI